MTQDRSVKAEIERLVAKWRDSATNAKRLIEGKPTYVSAEASAETLRRCANELDSLLSALIAEAPQVQKEQGDTRVEGPTVMPPERATAAENQTKGATVTPNQANNEIPRRARLDLLTPVERAIYGALQDVESMPADVRLTDAVVLLQAARNSVADYIDGINQRRFVADDCAAILASVRRAINPPDRGGISLHEWNQRLKVATAEIDTALSGAGDGNQQPRSDAVDPVAPRRQEGSTRDKSSPRSAPATAEE